MYRFLPILLFAFAMSITTDNIYENSHALIIGIDKYDNAMNLNYAVNDAQSIYGLLISGLGYEEKNVTLLLNEDATKERILLKLSEITRKAKNNDRIIIYFAGHGETLMLPSGGDMGYLIPVDGNLDNLYLSSIPMDVIYNTAPMSRAKHILYLFDAALGGLNLNARTRRFKVENTPEFIIRLTKEKGINIISAGGRGDFIQERAEWGHSAFTRSILKGIGSGMADDNDDGIITTTELGGFIRNNVVSDTDGMQTPQRGFIGTDIGEFIFILEEVDDSFRSIITEKKSNMTNARVDSLMKLFKTNSNKIKEFNENELFELITNITKRYDISPMEENKILSRTNKDIYDDSWALIIGINKYTNAPLLKYAVNDANEIKKLLINNFSFNKKNVKILTDEEATLSAIRRELESIAKASKENDRVIIYFAGHGKTLLLKNGMEIGYLIPVDGDMNSPFATGLAMDNVSKISLLSESKHMLFLMDACYSGLMAETPRGLNKTKDEEGYINTVSNLSARQIITAGGAQQEAMEADEWQHSAFTHNLLKALDDWEADSDSDGFITAGELGEYLRKTVTDVTLGKQTPEVGRLRYSDSGEFIFFHKK